MQLTSFVLEGKFLNVFVLFINSYVCLNEFLKFHLFFNSFLALLGLLAAHGLCLVAESGSRSVVARPGLLVVGASSVVEQGL